jgi:hypothetical protein
LRTGGRSCSTSFLGGSGFVTGPAPSATPRGSRAGCAVNSKLIRLPVPSLTALRNTLYRFTTSCEWKTPLCTWASVRSFLRRSSGSFCGPRRPVCRLRPTRASVFGLNNGSAATRLTSPSEKRRRQKSLRKKRNPSIRQGFPPPEYNKMYNSSRQRSHKCLGITPPTAQTHRTIHPVGTRNQLKKIVGAVKDFRRGHGGEFHEGFLSQCRERAIRNLRAGTPFKRCGGEVGTQREELFLDSAFDLATMQDGSFEALRMR